MSRTAAIRNGAVTFALPNHQYTVERLEIRPSAGQTASLYIAADPAFRDGVVADEVLIADGATLTHTGQVYVGHTSFSNIDPDRLLSDLHARRSLRIENGAKMTTVQAKVMGPSAGDGSGIATVDVTGPFSTWDVGKLSVGGPAGAGKINISEGGQIDVPPGVEVVVDSPSASSESVIDISGSAVSGQQTVRSQLLVSNSNTVVGKDGHGRLNIRGGGGMASDTTILGDETGSQGIATIEGPGTLWAGSTFDFASIAVGRNGRGELTLRDGAELRALISLGETERSPEGVLVVEGREAGVPEAQQTRLKAPQIRAGVRSNGLLTIKNGAIVESLLVELGQEGVGGNGTATVTGSGTKLLIDNTLNVGGANAQGALAVTDGAVVEGPILLVNVLQNGRVEIRNTGRIVAGGVNIAPGGELRGDHGTLVVAAEEFINNRGTLEIGASPGQFRIEGNYQQPAGGMLEIEIGGLTPGEHFDLLQVTGDAKIDGTVQLKFLDGFAPQQGQQFEFLAAGGAADLSDASYELQNLAPSFEFEIAPSANGISVTALNDGMFIQPVTWNVDADGDWSNVANWDPGDPNADHVSTSFLDATTAPRTINIDGPKTVASLTFDNANSYTLAGPGPLQFDNGGYTSIQVTSGVHAISAPLSIADGTTLTKRDAGTLTISGPQSHGTGALLVANGGITNLNSDGGTNLSVQVNTRLNFGATQHLGGVTISEGGRATLTAGGEKDLVTKSLSIAGGDAPSGTLDLTDNAAVIDYAGTSPAATVRNQILAGRGAAGFGATWSGRGITSSFASRQVAAEPESVSVSYADNSELPLGAYTTFLGEAVDDSAVLIRYTRTGDANLDGVVNDDDVTILGAFYAPGEPNANWALGDFDYNGFVDDDDVTLLGAFYDPAAAPTSTAAAGPAMPNTGAASIPEPATDLLILAMLAAATSFRIARIPARFGSGR
jgi:T5SS/PEP-CTERM-associated repeat protein